ncbi:Uncharacterized protein Adt_32263 [Abeliophyllum distichum]|uniref:Reverse transcriptase domain-containing protein n=1 Tax=Abeliophyllum distichum TaxID=126358 RepID=A0ABD1QSV0_9LAMI
MSRQLIVDDVLLAQALLHTLDTKVRGSNVILKLDMAKAYDHMDWSFLLSIMEGFRFDALWIDQIRRCILKCRFSRNLMEDIVDFSHHLRGSNRHIPSIAYKHGGNALISHLSFADDMIIFANGQKQSIRRVLQCIEHYDGTSGQLVNRDKSGIILPRRFYTSQIHRLENKAHRPIGGDTHYLTVKIRELFDDTGWNIGRLLELIPYIIAEEEDYWSKKSRVKWLNQGDRNSKFFHVVVKKNKSKNKIIQIRNIDDRLIQSEDEIQKSAVDYFQNVLTKEPIEDSSELVESIPNLITLKDNNFLNGLPSIEEVKEVVFSLNKDSVAGPDGYSGLFCQLCSEVIQRDLDDAVVDFIYGKMVPIGVTVTSITLIQKKQNSEE